MTDDQVFPASAIARQIRNMADRANESELTVNQFSSNGTLESLLLSIAQDIENQIAAIAPHKATTNA